MKPVRIFWARALLYDDSDEFFFHVQRGMELSSHRPLAVSTGHSEKSFLLDKKRSIIVMGRAEHQRIGDLGLQGKFRTTIWNLMSKGGKYSLLYIHTFISCQETP